MRKTSFAEGEFYHVYNRGVDKRDIFSEQYDLSRFLQSMREFNTLEPIGSIYEKTLLKIISMKNISAVVLYFRVDIRRFI